MSVLRYISHPDVTIDPEVPVTEWSLSDEGRRRVRTMLDQPWVASIERIVTSPERKARETAAMLAAQLGLPVEIRHGTGEIDRSATGFVTAVRHEELADRLFATPSASADGWETAVDAQQRIVTAALDLLGPSAGTTAIVGHGGVGTLLWCHLCDLPLDRRHDQPGQGHHWAFDTAREIPLHPWRPIDRIEEIAPPVGGSCQTP